MLLFVLVFALIVSWIYYTRRQNELLLKLKHVPDMAKHYPIIGIAHLFIGKLPDDIFNFLVNITAEVPSNVSKFFIFTKLFISVKSPAHIQKILSSSKCLDKASIYITIPAQNGLLTSKATKWKNHRKVLNSTFHITLFQKTFMQQFNKTAHLLVADLQCKTGIGTFDIKHFISYRSVGLQLETMFEADIGDKEIQGINENIETLQNILGQHIVSFFKYFMFYFIAKLLKIKLSIERLVENNINQFEVFVKIARNKYFEKLKLGELSDEDVKNKPEALIHKLVALEDRGYFTNQDVKDHIMTMIFAGSDTITTALSNIILCLAMNQQAQQNCANEIKEMMGDQFDTISIDDLINLELLERTINECLRLLPPIPVILRRSYEDLELDNNIIIPADTEIIIPIINLHRCKEYWGENATKFNPDNFLPENVAKRPLLSYLPYSYGPRNCIGKKYAQHELKIILAHLLVNYKFSTDLQFEDLKIGFGLTMMLKNNYMIRMEKR